jgi:vacuolar-type H+-ATPase catalytic subunit A/Vma1
LDVNIATLRADNLDSTHRWRPSFMKFCPVVPEICRGQVYGSRKERRIIIIIIRIRIRIRIRIIIIRNGAKTISLQTLFGRLN